MNVKRILTLVRIDRGVSVRLGSVRGERCQRSVDYIR